MRLAAEGRLVEGEFRPGGTRREWTDAGVLRMLRRRSLAKLRHEVEPVDQAVLGRFATTWQGIVKRRHGADALLDAIEQLQGAPLPASILETEILPARIDVYDPADLDAVTAAGEVVWVGVEPLGERDGRVALYLADHLPRLLPPTVRLKPDSDRTPDVAAGVDGRRLQTDRDRAVRARNRDPRHACAIAARRSSGRCTKRSAAAIPAKRSTRCGISCGTGCHQRHVSRAARVHAHARAAAADQRAPAGRAVVPFAAPRAAVGRRTLDAGAAVGARSGRDAVAESRRAPRHDEMGRGA